MPLRSELKAASTAAEPGTWLAGAGGVCAEGGAGVRGVCRAGLRAGAAGTEAFVLVVRGRAVVDEFAFCPCAAAETASAK